MDTRHDRLQEPGIGSIQSSVCHDLNSDFLGSHGAVSTTVFDSPASSKGCSPLIFAPRIGLKLADWRLDEFATGYSKLAQTGAMVRPTDC